jgi:hypothetical protein
VIPNAQELQGRSRGSNPCFVAGNQCRWTQLGGGKRSSYGGATKASIAAREREAKAAAREADIERVASLEKALTSVHSASFPEAARAILPPVDEVDTEPLREQLEAAAGIPALREATGGGEMAPVAPEPEPVDRYELMRSHRKRARAGIPFWRIRDQIDAARTADVQAEDTAARETAQRVEAQRQQQAELDRLWQELATARARVADELVLEAAAEKERRVSARAAEQEQLDAEWERLKANDLDVTLPLLEQAFADNEAPAAAIDCDGNRTTVVMQFVTPEAIIPERKPARTPTGKPTLRKRTKTEINALYLQALGSNVLATVKETFAVAPGTDIVQMLVIRRETDKKHAGELAAIYIGEFDRSTFAAASGSRDPARALETADEPHLNLKGKTEAVSPIDLANREDLTSVLDQIEQGLGT